MNIKKKQIAIINLNKSQLKKGEKNKKMSKWKRNQTENQAKKKNQMTLFITTKIIKIKEKLT